MSSISRIWRYGGEAGNVRVGSVFFGRLKTWGFVIGILLILIGGVGWLGSLDLLTRPCIAVGIVLVAVCSSAVSKLRGHQFTLWIIAAVIVPLLYPSGFQRLCGIELRSPWLMLPVTQLVMFGMGTQMSLRDFAGVVRAPWGILVGVISQFTIMPLVGYCLAKASNLPGEIAAGIILIGSCSSGLASNVMNYIARANLGLSVTLTAVTTLLAPTVTPFWMKVLASHLVKIDFLSMMSDIIKIVIVPIGAAMVHDWLKNVERPMRAKVAAYSLACLIWPAICINNVARGKLFAVTGFGEVLEITTFLAAVPAVGWLFHALWRRWNRIQQFMPILSMGGIIYYTAVTTAAGRNELLSVGGVLLVVAMAHNLAGYLLGYWFSRLMGLNKIDARTVSIEVGMQNGGMATGIATMMGKLSTLGLPAIVFSPWMNFSASLLANYWRKKSEKA